MLDSKTEGHQATYGCFLMLLTALIVLLGIPLYVHITDVYRTWWESLF